MAKMCKANSNIKCQRCELHFKEISKINNKGGMQLCEEAKSMG